MLHGRRCAASDSPPCSAVSACGAGRRVCNGWTKMRGCALYPAASRGSTARSGIPKEAAAGRRYQRRRVLPGEAHLRVFSSGAAGSPRQLPAVGHPIMQAFAVALLNQKGGVGKTSTCHHLAGTFAKANRQVLLIDADPQASLTQGFWGPDAMRSLSRRATIAALFDDGIPPEPAELIRPTEFRRRGSRAGVRIS